ncbi:bifunctional salicylyl-CoA 5-hydroxylase/oxidoreductase [Solicola gregarius]|uniref:Bifunctional salicylyl-CoA 5-hydroxylase/oxidoreductase n=1 Tax=Solicola gregarius TaxID=2908642 RepID=A0AA46TKF1_9ACTN|nr:bifunctional salicylyl-CoA 5-hydroxylase/oxidoreductase [Solicola gregarius]UYM06512.1 bifunctional salicylyl-CoA 5-hydroxylase/oxidoreductase [Solicola gregarius]
MRIAVIGGGPGGLYFAALTKQIGPEHDITVWERNAADDTFGFGVVFSDETLGGIEHADPRFHAQLEAEFARWDDIDVHYRGEVITSSGHGFAAMGRKRLLELLQQRCAELGVDVRFCTEAPDVEVLRSEYDLVVAADGLNSAIRRTYAGAFRPHLDERRCKYMWLGTSRVFESFTFSIRDTPHGIMQLHGYPYDDKASTFIVELNESVWREAGFDRTLGDRELAPGESDEESIARVRELFADELGGYDVMANNSRWVTFTTVSNESWVHDNVVLLGDAAHTAHFSIGSGTKLAMEDALSLAACLHEHTALGDALAAYETERRSVVESTQRAAQASLEWFEDLSQYTHQEPLQFAFNILTRSRRITYDNLRMRDPEFVARVDAWFAEHERERGHAPGDVEVARRGALESERVWAPDPARPRNEGAPGRASSDENAAGRDAQAREPSEPSPRDLLSPPMFQPFRLGELELQNRVVVSPMDQYVARDGMPGDFHFTHLTGKALGSPGLVMTEMVCVSPEGRITPGCAGMWSDEQATRWRRITDFVHAETKTKIGIQLGHSGAKGSTRLMWEGIDQPLESGNWAVAAASPVAYNPDVNQVPRELTRDELVGIREQFVASTVRAADAGFDLVELHCAHGYLLSGFISPITNQRTDEYGGSLENRLRFPLEVFAAMREAWPADRPMTVRVSATDWCDGGLTPDDALGVAQAFEAAGAAAIDVSTGQVTSAEQPAFGRSYQTPYADRIRNRLHIPTIAVGVISSYDDVNSILLAGRADLCALGRVHLYDPNWTLHAAVEQDYDGPGVTWPLPWRAGRRKPQTGRPDAAPPPRRLPTR